MHGPLTSRYLPRAGQKSELGHLIPGMAVHGFGCQIAVHTCPSPSCPRFLSYLDLFWELSIHGSLCPWYPDGGNVDVASCAVDSDPAWYKKICFPVQRRTSHSLLSSLTRFTVESVNFSNICVSRERSPENLPA